MFLWGSGVITGVDFNPVNESVKKLVFYGRVKKKRGDESIISVVNYVLKPSHSFLTDCAEGFDSKLFTRSSRGSFKFGVSRRFSFRK